MEENDILINQLVRQNSMKDAELLAGIIRSANREIAIRFALTQENCSKHPSFCSPDWVRTDFGRGGKYYSIFNDKKAVGCVLYEKAEKGVIFLNRLAVLPNEQKNGYGSKLVAHVISQGRKEGMKEISIGIIAAHYWLVRWYEKIGFRREKITKIQHLPFDVLYMKYIL